mmetsp:Transcript_5716/g.17680  ORF Transcript_5716/g.17680 Transcript_5716/m.17680 type:complete len:1069 (+) Transcript_5716:62-3268(+)
MQRGDDPQDQPEAGFRRVYFGDGTFADLPEASAASYEGEQAATTRRPEEARQRSGSVGAGGGARARNSRTSAAEHSRAPPHASQSRPDIGQPAVAASSPQGQRKFLDWQSFSNYVSGRVSDYISYGGPNAARSSDPAQVLDAKLVRQLQRGMSVLFYDHPRGAFRECCLKADARLNFLYVLQDDVPVNVPAESLRGQRHVTMRFDTITGVGSGQQALTLCREQGITDSRLIAESVVVVQSSDDSGAADRNPITAAEMRTIYSEDTLVFATSPGQNLEACIRACIRTMPHSEVRREEATRTLQRYMRRQRVDVKAPQSTRLAPLHDVVLRDASAIFDPAVTRYELQVRFGSLGGSSASTYDASVPTDVALADCGSLAAELAAGLGDGLTAIECASVALGLEEAIMLRRWGTSLAPGVFKGNLGRFLLEDWAVGAMVPQDSHFQDVCRDVSEGLAKGQRGPWTVGKAGSQASLRAVQQRLQLETAFVLAMERCCAAGAMRPPKRVASASPWLAGARSGPEAQPGPADGALADLEDVGWAPGRLGWAPGRLSSTVTEVRFVESQADSWKKAAQEIILKLEQEGVRHGQVLGIDAHTGDLGEEAIFSAHYSPQLPDGGPLSMRYHPDEAREFSWGKFYERANMHVQHKQVVAMTASCSRDGGGVLYCFYYDKPRALHTVEVVESCAGSWTDASNEIIQRLYEADVQAGQVLWIDAHSNPPDGPAVFAAHFSRSMPGAGPLIIRCEAYHSRHNWSELYASIARQIEELELCREDILGITCSLDAQGSYVGFLFYRAPGDLNEVREVSHEKPGMGSWLMQLLSIGMCCSGGAALPRYSLAEASQDEFTSERSASTGRWRWSGEASRAVVGIDTTGDGIVDTYIQGQDLDGNGLPDVLGDASSGPNPVPTTELGIDTTGDGRVDTYIKVRDSDGNGIPDALEQAPAAPEIINADDGFTVLLGSDVFPGSNAETLEASDLAECKRLCRERGYGAFVVYNKQAFFRRETPAQCLAAATACLGSTVFINTGEKVKSVSEEKPARRRKLDATLHIVEKPPAPPPKRGEQPRDACRCPTQ